MLVPVAFALWLSAAPNPLVGRWDNGAGFVLVLEANGQGAIADNAPAEALRWKSSATQLSITQDGETVAYAFTLKNDTLKLSGGDLDEPVTFRRAGAAPVAAQAAPSAPAPRQLPANA